MDPMSWEAVAPLVDRVVPEGRHVNVVFRCPVTGEKVSSRAAMRSSGDGIVPVLGRQIASQAQYELRRELARGLRGALGGGLLGSVAHEVAWQGTQGMATATRREQMFSDDDQQEAIVRAFQQVQAQFRWEGRWRFARDPAPAWPSRASTHAAVGAGGSGLTTAPGFGGRAATPAIAPAPSAPPADPSTVRDVQLRALVEVAFADRTFGPEELELATTLDLDEPAVTSLRQRPLAAADVTGLSAEDREQTWLLAAAMAAADTHVSRDENAALERIGGLLGLSRQQRAELDRRAREHLLELLVREAWAQGEPSSAAALELRNQALRWGIPPIRLEQITQSVRAAG